MALIKCRECNHEISTSARACPNCGAVGRNIDLASKVFLGLVVISVIALGTFQYVERYEREQKLNAEVEARIEAKIKSFQGDANRQEDSNWVYQNIDDSMGRGTVSTATLKSINLVSLGPPYDEPQRATLKLKKHPKYGTDAIFSVENGQILCLIGGCKLNVRFGNEELKAFEASMPEDMDTTVVFVKEAKPFIKRLKKTNKIFIEVQFFSGGRQVFEFDTSNLNW
ncbi:MAG: zinc ribbon domain-containing protein [Gammaproteobacteria bacterium]|nr:MAG: zinc ribbon domain-containing protein [Gammaproteobacteria bacterium]